MKKDTMKRLTSNGRVVKGISNPTWTSKHNVKAVQLKGYPGHDVRYQVPAGEEVIGAGFLAEWRKLRGQ